MATHGGKRPGAGRRKGTPNKKSLEVAQRIEEILGESPVDKMAGLAKECVDRAREHFEAGNEKSAHAELAIAKDMLKEVSQYCAPKLRSIEHKGAIETTPSVIVIDPGERPDE